MSSNYKLRKRAIRITKLLIHAILFDNHQLFRNTRISFGNISPRSVEMHSLVIFTDYVVTSDKFSRWFRRCYLYNVIIFQVRTTLSIIYLYCFNFEILC